MATESVIRDTDFAAETANLFKNQALLQAGASVMSQSLQAPGLLTQLLRG
ncbi:MAG: hypothetical protein KatS3mg105_4272 [Gemmatales bacterium]|nr:MAG: hypothetical protein KatS3mg105_4272 [Gemmatales bacterium]